MPLQRVGPNNRAAIVPVASVVAKRREVPANEEDPPVGLRDPHSDDENPLPEERDADVAEEGTVAHCCLPGGCDRRGDVIYIADPGDAVKMVCNNESCTAGEWMHGACFQEWERQVLNYLRSCGRARSWSEKQRLQNLWTKKGYDLAFKACDCKCAKGHLRKDLGYIPPPARNAEVEKRQRRVRKLKPPPPQRRGSTGATQTVGESARTPLRIRTSSLCSAGSSPPSSEGMSPQTSSSRSQQQQQTRSGGKFEFFADPEQAAAGNIFHRRTDLSAFRRLPILLQNPYQIKVEDEGPHGNDETRSFILTSLSSQKVTVVSCIVCQVALPVYDKYPLVDGTFFLSPLKYSVNSVPVQQVSDHQHRRLHLSAVCMQCLSGANMTLMCIGCQAQWSGATLIIGTMYAYDIFAASPCCPWRLACKACARQVIEPGNAYQFYSQYSRLVSCAHCGSEDFHFVKPLHDLFRIVGLQR